MTPAEARASLNNILAEIYSTEASARRVASYAGLSLQRIAFSGTAINTWHSILREAENSEKIEDLLNEVLREYEMNQKLVQAIETYDAYRGRGKNTSTEIREQKPQTSMQSSDSAMITILFLAANPTDRTRLRLDEESLSINQALSQTEFRDHFKLEQSHAVRVADLQGLLLRYQPHIVHFSGHGSEANEIILEDNTGKSHPVSTSALSTVFSILKDNIRCVVLNACYSEPQAQAIAEHIDCVVGMSEVIGDRAAISFAAAFYQALGFGRDVKTAFELGRAQLDLENMLEKQTPRLLTTKVDPCNCFIVSLSDSYRQIR